MNSKKFYQRFVKDYNLPINVFEEDMFKYYMGLYDFFPSDIFENTVKMIDLYDDDYFIEWTFFIHQIR